MIARDEGLQRLLDLDGFLAEIGGGYWVKVEARRVPASAARPHGVAFSFSLHEPNGRRAFGIDNAHTVRSTKGPAGRSTKATAHIHRGGTVRPYVYRDADTLIDDFWRAVADFLRKAGIQ
jgi:hypothetical protein